MEFSTSFVISLSSTVICTLALISSLGVLARLKGCLRKSFAMFSLGIFFVYVAIFALLFYSLNYISVETTFRVVQLSLSAAALLILLGSYTATQRLRFVPDSLLNRVCLKGSK